MKKVPYEWQLAVCTCPDEKVKYERPGYGLPPWSTFRGVEGKCATCTKYRNTSLVDCVTCGKKYITFFSHPNRCEQFRECFYCVDKRDPSICEEGSCNICKMHREFRRKSNFPDIYSDEFIPEDARPRPMRDYREVLAEDFSLDLDF